MKLVCLPHRVLLPRQVDQLTDRLKRSLAEMENVRMRSARDVETAKKFGPQVGKCGKCGGGTPAMEKLCDSSSCSKAALEQQRRTLSNRDGVGGHSDDLPHLGAKDHRSNMLLGASTARPSSVALTRHQPLPLTL